MATMAVQCMNYIVTKLLRDLLDDLLYQNAPLTTMFRKLKVVSALLEHERLEEWLSKELGGYDESDMLPEYRLFSVSSQAFYDDESASSEAPALRTCDLPEELGTYGGTAEIYSSIGVIEVLVDEDAKELRLPWSEDRTLQFTELCNSVHPVVEIWKYVSHAHYASLITTLKNRLLDALITIINIYPEVFEHDEMLSAEKRLKIGKILYATMCCSPVEDENGGN